MGNFPFESFNALQSSFIIIRLYVAYENPSKVIVAWGESGFRDPRISMNPIGSHWISESDGIHRDLLFPHCGIHWDPLGPTDPLGSWDLGIRFFFPPCGSEKLSFRFIGETLRSQTQNMIEPSSYDMNMIKGELGTYLDSTDGGLSDCTNFTATQSILP